MQKFIGEEEKIDRLVEYYKDNGLLIVGLNDSQGVNTTSTFFKKGLLEYLAASLTSDGLKPEVINAFSLTMNKTEHIDYFLKNNLSVKDIKLSQIYSVISALEKVMTDIGLPKSLGQIGNAYRLIYTPEPDDGKIKLSTSLKQAYEPVVIYSSGVNDLMREVGANPFSIKKSYKEKDNKPNYYYTLDKVKDKETLNKVMDSIERNYNTILGINSNADIYTLGAYVPRSLQNEKMDIFRKLIIAYNERLIKLCREYKITYVNTEVIGKLYNKSSNNFHISTEGHDTLANYILRHMYYNKFGLNKKIRTEHFSQTEITNNGLEGIINDILCDYNQSIMNSESLTGYSKERQLAIAEEHKREMKICQKVLEKRKK